MTKASAQTKTRTDSKAPAVENPKTDGGDASNRIKDPDQWTTGSEPMTGAQASYLKTLSEETHEPEAFEPNLDKAEASKRIDALRKDAGRG
ncbi:DUF3072 domain-containing protein [uncultured Methylobacterium sp.]|uniref:DUF3072 domain-containing protein n=1 Tax=uncultured Methylobacterium sp. TaxID=157278 RepID=UPI0035CBEC5B